MRHGALRNRKLILGNGETAEVDGKGFFEASAAEAERLLTIPGFAEA